MKTFLMLALSVVVGGAAAFAQPRAAAQPVRMAKAPQGLMAPVWSPDGKQIAATGDNYAGIVVMNADGSGARTLTTAPGTGYKMVWTADGKEIVGRTNIYEGARLMHEYKAWASDGSAVRTIAGKARTNAAPVRSVARKGAATDVFTAMTADPGTACYKVSALAQFGDAVVINPALSPDGKTVAFQIPGKGMWLIGNDGTGLRSLGLGSNPSWMPDSRNIVYTVVSDNGSVYTASTLYGMDTANGKTTVIVSQSNLIPVQPAVAPDGSKVVFSNTLDASLYIVKLK